MVRPGRDGVYFFAGLTASKHCLSVTEIAMASLITCPACAAKLKVPDHLAGTGKLLKCPKCQERIPLAKSATASGVTSDKELALTKSESASRLPPNVVRSGHPGANRAAREMDTPSPDREDSKIAKSSKSARNQGKKTGRLAKANGSLDDMFEDEEVPPQYRKTIHEELAEDEEVVWLGRPVLEIRLKKAKMALIAGIVALVGGVGLLGAGIAMDVLPMTILGGVLAPMGILFMLAPFLVKRFAANREVYLVTNRRAIMYPPMRSYNRRQLHNKLELRESSYQEGAGSLIFEVKVEYEAGMSPLGAGRGSRGRLGPGPSNSGVKKTVTEYGFTDIADVIRVEKLIRNTILRRNADVTEDERDSCGDDMVEAASNSSGPAIDDDAKETPRKAKKPVGGANVEASRELIEDVQVSQSLKDRALDRLDDDERVIWVGQPCQKLILIRALGVSLVALIAAIVFAGLALRNPAREWVSLVAAGGALAFAIGTPIVRRLRAARTLYVLTQRRATVFEPNLLLVMTACDYRADVLSRMSRRNSWFVKGAGDLVFKTLTKITTTHTYDRRGGYQGSRTSIITYYWGFLAVEDAKDVERLINDHVVEPFLDRVNA
jgi:hypothetical protein